MIVKMTLHKKWFDLIACGKKKKEFRDLKPYWISRLLDRAGDVTHIHFSNGYSESSRQMIVQVKRISVKDEQIIISLGTVKLLQM